MLFRYVRNIMYTAAIYRQRGRHGCACLVARRPLSRLPPDPPEPDQESIRLEVSKEKFSRSTCASSSGETYITIMRNSSIKREPEEPADRDLCLAFFSQSDDRVWA